MTNQPDEKDIFQVATSLRDQPRRSSYLDSACGNDSALRQRVEDLLKAHESEGDFFSRCAPVDDLDMDSCTVNFGPGSMIGRYKIVEQIGEGGFGIVYMADQQEPIQRKVAVKVIKAGMDSKQVIARFEVERQALALMDHPNIARVLDAGATATGQPYFVMELVRGITLTEYCDQRGITTKERLRLFMATCSAVQHAHQKGIIHRDIKPTNILVATDGDCPVPKVIDFGVAKAIHGRLTDTSLLTQFCQFIGTPAYMSPEQAQMTAADVDTRTDIYSLGVLLYELLTGKTPLESMESQQADFEELFRRIREDEAFKPSTRLRSLSHAEISTLARNRRADPSRLPIEIEGDLDWIVMKALEKDRSRRYATAEALADDIGRHLNAEVVSAVPPSTSYLIRKFVRRHRRLLSTTGAIAGTLIVASIVSTWMAFNANKARKLLADEVVAKGIAVDEALKARETTEAEKLRATQFAYASDMKGASQALQQNDLGLARFYVRRNRPAMDSRDLRNWEWRALWRECQGHAIATFGEPSDIYWSLSVSPNQKWLATGEQQAGIRVWNLQTRELANTVVQKGVQDGPLGLAFSPTGDRMFGGTVRGLVKAWFVPSFTELPEQIQLQGLAAEICISYDGTHLAAYDQQHVTVWRLSTQSKPKPLAKISIGKRNCSLAFSPDGQFLAVGLNSEIRILDSATLDVLVPISRGGGFSVEFSPDGKILASAATITDTTIGLHRPATGEFVGRLQGHVHYVHDLAYSPDGRMLASASADHTIRLWNTETRTEEAVLLGHNTEVCSVQFTSDGKRLISGGKGEICVWNSSRQWTSEWPVSQEIVPNGWHRQYSQASYSKDSRWLATRNRDHSASLRSPKSLDERIRLADLGKNVRGVRFSPVENILAVGTSDGHLSFLNTDDMRFTSRVMLVEGGRIAPVDFSRDGKRLLLVVREEKQSRCIIWSVPEGREVRAWTISNDDECAAISPDGEIVVTGHSDGATRFWQVADPNECHTTMFHNPVFGVAFSSQGDHVAVANHELYILDSATRQIVGKMLGHMMQIHSINFSRDGKRIATGGGGEREAVKIWDVSTQQELMTLTTKGFSFRQVEFSPDGNSIMAIGGSRSLNVWHAPTIEEIDDIQDPTWQTKN